MTEPTLFDLPTARRRRRRGEPNGFASPPGSGPKGESCGTCRHYCSVQGGARAYPKCGLLRHRWTNGPGTDIRKSAPACRHWQKEEG